MGKILSLLIAAGYLVFAGITLGGEMLFKVLIFLIFPLACIWFSDEIGGFIGFSGLGITKASPCGLIRFMGWLFLLLSLLFIIFFVFHKGFFADLFNLFLS